MCGYTSGLEEAVDGGGGKRTHGGGYNKIGTPRPRNHWRNSIYTLKHEGARGSGVGRDGGGANARMGRVERNWTKSGGRLFSHGRGFC